MKTFKVFLDDKEITVMADFYEIDDNNLSFIRYTDDEEVVAFFKKWEFWIKVDEP